MKILTLQQEKAVSHSTSPLMIIAGAGTGKTFTLIQRVAYLINNYNVKPHNILLITYTERATQEMREKVVEELGSHGERIQIGTFHSICFNIVKEFGNTSYNPRILNQSEAVYLLLEAFDELGPFESSEFALDPEKAVINNFLPFFNRCADELIDPNTQLNQEKSKEVLAQINDLKRIFIYFNQIKTKRNIVDYGDMILKAHHLLSSNNKILNICQNRFRHIIVDEFQDNNHALNEVVKLLSGKRQSVTVVGDDDQVIYSFRGASSYNIEVFNKMYGGNKKFSSIPLEINFRSHQQILNVANNIIKDNNERQLKTLESHDKKEGPIPTLFWAENKNHADIIINQIRKLNNKGYGYEDIAILCRTRNQARGLSESLLEANIPTNADFRKFFEIPLIKTIVAWCQIIGNGKYQDIALYRIIREKAGGKVAFELFNKFNIYEKEPRVALLKSINSDLPSDVKCLIEIIRSIDYKKKYADELVWEISEKTGILKKLVKRYHYDDQVGLLNFAYLIKLAKDFSREEKNRGLIRFNNYLELMMRDRDWPAELPSLPLKTEAIHIQTIHSAKGSEFPVVFIPFNRSVSFPMSFRPDKSKTCFPDEWLNYSGYSKLTDRDHHIQEERRLMYVAVTRAKERLFLLAPSKATSIFIKNMDKLLVEEYNMESAGKSDLE